jgi:hypothetical protein
MNVGRHLERLHMTKIQPGAGVNRAPVLKLLGGSRCGFNTRRVSVPQGGSTLTSMRPVGKHCRSSKTNP